MRRPGQRVVRVATVVAATILASAGWAQVKGGSGGAPPEPAPVSDILQAYRSEQQLQREQALRDLSDFNLDRRIKANELVPIGQRALVDYGAYASFNYLTVRDRTDENRAERIYEGVGYFRLNLDGAQEVFVRGRYSYFDWANGKDDSFDGRGDRDNDDYIDRAYYRFDLGRAFEAYEGKTSDSGLAIQAGRDLVYWANGLVLGQRLDGVVADAHAGPVSMQAIAGVTPHYTVDFDASRPAFDHDTRRGFFGGYFSADVDVHQPFLYVLSQQDFNDDGPEEVSGFRSKFNYDSFYVGLGSNGAITDHWSYSVEAAYEFGSGLTSPAEVAGAALIEVPQKEEPIRAWAANGRLEYVSPGENKIRLSFEETVASGDRDRIASSSDTVLGNRHGADNAFNGFGLINPGLAFFPNLSNLSISRIGVSGFPIPDGTWTRRMQVGADAFAYFRLLKSAVIDEQVQDDGRFMGLEPDVYLNWQITSDVTLSLRYGVFFPSNNLVADDQIREFFFGGITYAF